MNLNRRCQVDRVDRFLTQNSQLSYDRRRYAMPEITEFGAWGET